MLKISPDLVAGTLLTAIGALAAVVSASYPLGTAQNMGAGYFPLIVSCLLAVVGIAILIRSQVVEEEPVTAFRWRSTIMVLASIAIFGLTVEGLGSFLAILLTLACSYAGSARARLGLPQILGGVAFAALCSFVFSVLLGLPMPVVGDWLRPLFST